MSELDDIKRRQECTDERLTDQREKAAATRERLDLLETRVESIITELAAARDERKAAQLEGQKLGSQLVALNENLSAHIKMHEKGDDKKDTSKWNKASIALVIIGLAFTAISTYNTVIQTNIAQNDAVKISAPRSSK
jgi:chromosome segregation ATPase